MAYINRFAPWHRARVVVSLLMVSALPSLSGSVAAQNAEQVLPQEEPSTPDSGQYQPESTHAVREADTDLALYILNNPAEFIGRNLTFVDGTVIGPILDLRRKVDDLELYLVVDASAYFNDETTYAVKVQDVESFDEESVKVPEDAGMHLRGQVYYAEDYTDADDFNPEGYDPLENEAAQ